MVNVTKTFLWISRNCFVIKKSVDLYFFILLLFIHPGMVFVWMRLQMQREQLLLTNTGRYLAVEEYDYS